MNTRKMDEQSEIIARMNRWADYRWQPPANPPRRDPRLVALWDPWRAVLETATDSDWRALYTAYAADPGWLDAYNEAVALGGAAGRAGDVAAVRSAAPSDGYDEYGIRDEAPFVGYAVLLVAVLADVLPPDLRERLVAPWRAAFGATPVAW